VYTDASSAINIIVHGPTVKSLTIKLALNVIAKTKPLKIAVIACDFFKYRKIKITIEKDIC